MGIRALSIAMLAGICAALPACDSAGDDNLVRAAFIGEEEQLTLGGARLSVAAQHVRAATVEGLVAMETAGDVIPAVSERWLVTEDGTSYIFRLRDSNWPDGAPLTSNSVKAALERNLRDLEGTSLGLDLAIISDVRAMAGRVVEIRLKSPMPGFLRLMAQPEMGLRRDVEGMGPMRPLLSPEGQQLANQRAGNDGDAPIRLVAVSPDQRGLPAPEDWQEDFRAIAVSVHAAEAAVQRFEDGEADLVLNGTLANLPLADLGPLSRGTVRLDGVPGLLGMRVMRLSGVLAETDNREALAMAIDRDSLLDPFNLSGSALSTRLAATETLDDDTPVAERWADLTLEDRQAIAAARIASWSARSGEQAALTIAMPDGPGSDLLYEQLEGDFAAIGVRLRRALDGEKSDLALVDRLARYAGRRWFLNQFNCSLDRGTCSPRTDDIVERAMTASDAAQRDSLLIEAEDTLLATNIYIPFGSPVRWSLIRGNVDGFTDNGWGLHPLFALAQRPI